MRVIKSDLVFGFRILHMNKKVLSEILIKIRTG